MVEAYRVRYEDVELFENEVYDGIAGMLDELAEAGFTLSLATAKPQQTAIRIVEHFGFTSYFSLQAGATIEVGSGRRTKADVILCARRARNRPSEQHRSLGHRRAARGDGRRRDLTMRC